MSILAPVLLDPSEPVRIVAGSGNRLALILFNAGDDDQDGGGGAGYDCWLGNDSDLVVPSGSNDVTAAVPKIFLPCGSTLSLTGVSGPLYGINRATAGWLLVMEVPAL